MFGNNKGCLTSISIVKNLIITAENALIPSKLSTTRLLKELLSEPACPRIPLKFHKYPRKALILENKQKFSCAANKSIFIPSFSAGRKSNSLRVFSCFY